MLEGLLCNHKTIEAYKTITQPRRKLLKNKLLTVVAATLLVLYTAPQAEARQKKSEAVIADFEGKNPVANNTTTHKAIVTVVDDVPEELVRELI